MDFLDGYTGFLGCDMEFNGFFGCCTGFLGDYFVSDKIRSCGNIVSLWVSKVVIWLPHWLYWFRVQYAFPGALNCFPRSLNDFVDDYLIATMALLVSYVLV